MVNCIKDMQCKEVKRNPLSSLNKKVSDLVGKGSWPDKMKLIVKTNSTAVIPAITGRLKDHKEEMPLRPIVLKCSGPTYFIEKAFVQILKDLLQTSEYTVQSTSNFIDKLNSFQPPDNYILASLDIVSLYPSIDTQRVLTIICDKIDHKQDLSSLMKTTLKSALNLIINNNFFRFDNRVYLQEEGAPMGSPISGLLAEFILRPLEEDINCNFKNPPMVWWRYVDDVFIVWQHDVVLLDEFFSLINGLNPKIKFTLEKERDKTLQFLDVLLIRTPIGIERKIFRKPISTLATIPHNAEAPMSYKLSAYRHLIYRANKVCTPKYLDSELKIIRKIARNNGFRNEIINKLIRNMKNSKPKVNNDASKLRTIQYFPGFFERIKYKLKKFGIHLVAKPGAKLKNLIHNGMDHTENDNKAGVYEIPFIRENGRIQFYIGMTGRSFKTRKKEHMADVKFGRQTTALARLNNKEPLHIKFEESKIIYPSRFYYTSVIRESIEIFLRSESICNESASFNLPGIWREMLERTRES